MGLIYRTNAITRPNHLATLTIAIFHTVTRHMTGNLIMHKSSELMGCKAFRHRPNYVNTGFLHKVSREMSFRYLIYHFLIAFIQRIHLTKST